VSDFVFATCAPGFEPALKREVARTRPELRLSYSRPGLVTFKSPREVAPEDPPGSVFARVWGRALGAAADPAAASEKLAASGATRVHAFARDPAASTAEPALLAPWQALGPGGAAAPGELVADVIVAPGEPAWLGVHRHDDARPAHPGGAIPIELPADAPSRAYAKIEEAIAWARLPVAAGQVALEIGAAPGGAALALARRGLTVWGVDTGALAPHVLAHPNVRHVPKKVGALRWEELPARVDWLLVDVNLAPQVALHEVARLMPPLRPALAGAVLTLKLNDWAFVDELPALADRIRAMGLLDVRLRHLPSNRREVCAVALAGG
jgi:23S rRNA (cytidine2498-2'-O)-methyltransferase